jgi:hypothetical protein
MAARLGATGGPTGTDSALLRDYLRACADQLGSTLRADHASPFQQCTEPSWAPL